MNSDSGNENKMPEMAGVTIAPANEGPVDASASKTNISSGQPRIVNTTSVVPTTTPTSQAISTPQNFNASATTPNVFYPQQNFNVSPTTPNVFYPQQNFNVPVPMTNFVNNSANAKGNSPKKKKTTYMLIAIIFFLIVGMIAIDRSNRQKIAEINYNCTPVASSEKEIPLDINSTIVKNLYSKVATNIREDVAQPEFNEEMKLYLAYRQILEKDKYDSNCNLFSNVAMQPYTCTVSTSFVPKAFKKETLEQKIKELYGEDTFFNMRNIQLGNTCLIGYQYIAQRGEFVEGLCNEKMTTSYKVTKNLVSAVSTQNTIILEEEVKYSSSSGRDLPESLKSGTYYYTFRLDMNYNYVLFSKTYENKY